MSDYLRPTICNVCGGEVKYLPNFIIYGSSHGSGMCYLCSDCGAYTGTHENRPQDALSLLANSEMRDLKIKCHELFDPLWKRPAEGGLLCKKMLRNHWYKWLSRKLGVPLARCHFGRMDMEMLQKAYDVLMQQTREMRCR